MTPVQHKISVAIGRARLTWLVFLLASGIYIVMNFAGWALIFLVPIAIVSYFIFTVIAAVIVSFQISPDEMAQQVMTDKLFHLRSKIESENIEVGSDEWLEAYEQAEITNILEVGDVSKELVGHYQGKEMHEWVEIRNPDTDRMERYVFHSVGEYRDGLPVIPEEEGVLFAHVDGILYTRNI